MKITELIPPIVIVYFVSMVIANLGIIDQVFVASLSPLKNYLLSALIIMLLLRSNIRFVMRLRVRLLGSFFVASGSIVVGFVLMWWLMKGYFEPQTYLAFGALSGSWIGGSANMIAVGSALEVEDAMMGFVLITDTVCYAIWLFALLFSSSYAERFNTWSKASTSGFVFDVPKHQSSRTLDISSIVLSLAIAGVMVSVLSGYYVVLVSTIIGVGLSFTPLSRNQYSSQIGFCLLYGVIAIVGLGANIEDFSKAPLFIFAGFIVLTFHLLMMVIYAKLFKIDLFSISVSSLANIGGVASAPLLAATYNPNLVSVGVVMAMLGYVIGTFGGLWTAHLMGLL